MEDLAAFSAREVKRAAEEMTQSNTSSQRGSEVPLESQRE